MDVAVRVVEELGSLARPIVLQPGEALVLEGEEANEVFVLRSGRLIASARTPFGDVDIGVVEAGQLAGEVTSIAGGTRTATLRADAGADVVAIPRAEFERWLGAHAELADEVAAAARERIDRRQVATMATRLLGVADADLVRRIVDGVHWCRVDAGDVVFEQGDVADAVYFIVSGRLEAVIGAPTGGDVIAHRLGRGEIVGEIGLIDAAPRSATVRAVRDTTLARLSAATFEALIAEQPVLMLALVRGIVARLNRPVSRATKRAATVTVAMTAPVDTAQIIAGLLAEISRHARVEHLSSRRVDTLLVRKDIAQVSGEDAGAPRLAEFLHEVDVVNDHVLLEVDPQMTAWTRRALRQADRAVLVVSSSPGRDECRRVDELIGALDGIDHVRTLAVVHPGGDERPRDTAALIERFAADEVVHVRAGSAADVARLARMISGHGVGLVLGGGGARGFAHLGVYRALRECGVPVDQVGGSSIGAPIGAAIALDLPLDEIEGVVEAQFRRLLDYTLPLVSVLKGRRISRSIDDALGTTGIEDMWLGFYCVSTNLTTSRLQVHRRGRVADAVRASVAIPGVLPPVPAGDHLLVDGGVLDNLPIGQMHDDSRIGTVIAVDVAPPNGPRSKRDYGTSVSGWRALGERLRGRPPSYPRLGAVLLRSMLTGAVRSQHEALRDIDVDLLVDLRLPGVGLLDFERVRPVAQAGYDGARARIEAWAATQPWLAAAS